MDLPFTQERSYRAKVIDKVITILDHKDADFSKKYGFLIEELRLLARCVIVIDKNGIVQYVKYVLDAKYQPNCNNAYKEARNLI